MAEEIVAVEAAVFGGEGLHLAIHRACKCAREGAREVAGKQAVPIAAPHQFDDVPAGACKQLFEFIDDAAVATHWPVQPLQVAVHHPHQVIQAFTRGQGQRAHGLGLVHLAIAKHAPDFSALAVQQGTVGQVTHEARVVNRTDRAYAHGPGGELPEVGHQVRVWVAGEPARPCPFACGRGADFLAVMQQVVLAQAAFQIGPRINARRTVRLEEDQVAAVLRIARVKEMVEAGFKQIGGTGIAGNVATQFAIGLVGAHHHGQGVPAHEGGQAFFNGQVAGEGGLLVHWNGVDIGR